MSGFLSPSQGLGEDGASLITVKSVNPGPDTLTKLVRRLRAMTLQLLPVEVEPEGLNEPTSRVITPQVIAAYRAAAGDFVEALPYCLLRARAEFMYDANHNPADYGENLGRAIACEVLARRIVHIAEPDRIATILSKRYQHRQIDGDESEMASALEVAIDQHCTIFLSSSESQDVVNQLWTGELVQKITSGHDNEYVRYEDIRENSFWGHLDVSRLSVPRYQNMFRILIWFAFLVVYSQAVREPLDRLDPNKTSFDGWEVVLYLYPFLSSSKFFKLLNFVTWRTFSFWNGVAFITDSLLLSAFVLRLMGIQGDPEQQVAFRMRSFQVLSFVAPFIWMKLVTVFDGYKYIGTMQICVARMLKESGIFFALLSVLGIGFAQGLYALDAADGSTESPAVIVHVLIQALLQAPDFSKYSLQPVALSLYYLWSAVTAIVLLNVLISLFSSAYADVVEDAEAQYLAFFAQKTVGMLRAPDSYVYPAPFNLVEVFFVAPFEMIPGLRLNEKRYAQVCLEISQPWKVPTYAATELNRIVMSTIFCIPLAAIALFESLRWNRQKPNSWMNHWFRGDDEGGDDSPANRNPTVDDPNCQGLQISKVPFEELITVFPNTQMSSEATIVKELDALKKQIEALTKMLEARQG
ncbi:calcium activated cation channel [Coprinellus micaceus]|uniref:Calcium activated cation channel n=1 Tax=Coprinellus micaceus TaxID=71717 RepID=A0A4Y7TQ71_COPMI|nr:calcium activated cation channel [Coprinellus micaceus]